MSGLENSDLARIYGTTVQVARQTVCYACAQPKAKDWFSFLPQLGCFFNGENSLLALHLPVFGTIGPRMLWMP